VTLLGLLAWLFVTALPAQPRLDGPVDRIVVDKSSRLMVLYRGAWPVRFWPVALGRAPEGAKAVQGDGRTPEGVFRIDRLNPGSAFHLSLGLDYPHPAHTRAARARGRSPGGDIFIHGQPNAMPPGFIMRGDWTDGCIAVTNGRIEALYDAVGIGTEVEIRP
jgi:murein L,D-transpeptidase YafK